MQSVTPLGERVPILPRMVLPERMSRLALGAKHPKRQPHSPGGNPTAKGNSGHVLIKARPDRNDSSEVDENRRRPVETSS